MKKMLKIPKITIETMKKISREIRKKENEEKERYNERLQRILEEFASEQPALMAMISQLGDLGVSPNISIAMMVYKAIKIECENSTLESFLDVK